MVLLKYEFVADHKQQQQTMWSLHIAACCCDTSQRHIVAVLIPNPTTDGRFSVGGTTDLRSDDKLSAIVRRVIGKRVVYFNEIRRNQ